MTVHILISEFKKKWYSLFSIWIHRDMFNTFDPTEKEKHHAITAIPIFLMKAKSHLKLHQPGFFTSIFTAVIMDKRYLFARLIFFKSIVATRGSKTNLATQVILRDLD